MTLVAFALTPRFCELVSTRPVITEACDFLGQAGECALLTFTPKEAKDAGENQSLAAQRLFPG